MRASSLGLCLTLPVSSHSAKQLVRGEPNVSYICSRYYRAPELIFGATDYTSSIGQLGNRDWGVAVLAGFKLLGTVEGLVIKAYRLFQHWFSQVEAGAGASCLEQSDKERLVAIQLLPGAQQLARAGLRSQD